MNGHNWFASRFFKQNVTYQMRDNAFLQIEDWKKHSSYPTIFELKISISILGTRIKHQMGAVSLKMYDKFTHQVDF